VVGLDHPAIEAQMDRRPQCVFDLQHERGGTLEGRPPSGQWGSWWKPRMGQAAPMRSAHCPEIFNNPAEILILFTHQDQQSTLVYRSSRKICRRAGPLSLSFPSKTSHFPGREVRRTNHGTCPAS
jgi:hypothetical protein